MNRTLLSTLLALALLAACNSGNDKTTDETAGAGEIAKTEEPANASAPKRYLIKSGVITYTLSGDQSGTETLYFDDWGAREAKYTNATMKVMGMETKRNEIAIIDGEYMYTIDMEEKTGTRMKNPILSQLRTGDDEELIEYGKKMLERMGGKQTGSEDVLGRTCDVYSMDKPKVKTWTWKVIPLKTQAEMMDMKLVQTATSIEENVAIPSEKFMVPEGVTIQDYNTGA